ncbi:54S ribosomal protein L3 mitochondrial [Diatrype stigma]|uniref:Large ribosomal subunit protein mL44 n=1 Tax=Diatrype stigma TaxID=117547 RepID=A0AAN9UPM9_9PEZI
MKRLERLSGQLLSSTAAAAAAGAVPCRPANRRIPRAAQTCRSITTKTRSSSLYCSRIQQQQQQIRCQSSATPPAAEADADPSSAEEPAAPPPEFANEDGVSPPNVPAAEREEAYSGPPPPLPSPHPSRAAQSAKLAALHARLSLSSRVPVQTLARALVDPSADGHPRYSNANLAWLGASLLQYHASEWLVARYPRLPMAINFAALKGLVGPPALHQIARSWGVEAAAAPGEEVDPGLLQYDATRGSVSMNMWGYVRSEAKEIQKYKFRRGMSSRILYDDAFGELLTKAPKRQGEGQGQGAQGQEGENATAATTAIPNPNPEVSGARNHPDSQMLVPDAAENAHANFVRAVVGAVYLHCDRHAAKRFAQAHVLSRRLDLAGLFAFRHPERELTRLCAREGFEAPLARLLSETGRLSRTPVFVVGIYSGRHKLGEGIGPSLDAGRTAASINALKSWYLYSPGDHVAVPSDAFAEDGSAAPWKPLYVDLGEVVT